MAIPVTPQANRAPNSLARNLRNSFESEAWDDNASVVWEAPTDLTSDTIAAGAALVVCSFQIGTPIEARLQLEAQVHGAVSGGAGIWSAYIRQDTVDTIWSETMRWPDGLSSNVVWTGTVDVAAGVYTFDINISVDALSVGIPFRNKRLICRRGRKPSSS